MSKREDFVPYKYIEILRRQGLINETAWRDLGIRRHYFELRRQSMRGKQALMVLSEIYFLSVDRINSIVHKKNGGQK